MSYEVLTWDSDKGDFTPQPGVRRGPYSKWGLRRALRKLQRLGYETSKAGGVSVLVYNKTTHSMAARENLGPGTLTHDERGDRKDNGNHHQGS